MFKIILTNNKEDIALTFKVRETPIAKKWFAELCKNYSIYENDRFSNSSDPGELTVTLNLECCAFILKLNKSISDNSFFII